MAIDSKSFHSQQMVHGRCGLFGRTTLRCRQGLGPLWQVIVHRTDPDRWSGALCKAGHRLCQALTSNNFARGAVALPRVVAIVATKKTR